MIDQPPPIPVVSSNAPDKDAEHLRLLSIFYFVHGALQLAGLAFGFLHYLVMRSIFMRPEIWQHSKGGGPPPPEAMFHFFIAMYILMGVFFLTGLLVNVLCGYFLMKRRRLMFCQIAAGFTCLSLPLGTILGAFTFIVLNRDGVRQKFATNLPATA
jgi:hypothetical protein